MYIMLSSQTTCIYIYMNDNNARRIYRAMYEKPDEKVISICEFHLFIRSHTYYSRGCDLLARNKYITGEYFTRGTNIRKGEPCTGRKNIQMEVAFYEGKKHSNRGAFKFLSCR